MQWLIGLLLLLVFAIVALSMIKYRVSPVLAILLLAIAWLIIAMVPPADILNTIQSGATAWASVVVIIAFGAWFGETLVKTGIAESIIRTAVEYAGDKPTIAAIVLFLVVALLFTSVYGVGVAIALGVIVIPILMGLGIANEVVNMIYLLAIALGTYFNMGYFFVDGPVFFGNKINEAIYRTLFPTIATQYVVGLIIGAVYIAFIVSRGKIRKTSSVNVGISREVRKLPAYTYIVPFIPFLLVMLANWPIIPAFIVGVAIALGLTHFIVKRKLTEDIDVFVRSWVDAFPGIAIITMLWISCGILIYASRLSQLQAVLSPIFGPVLPYDRIAATIFGIILGAFLAYYRGPGASVGTGAVIVALLQSVGKVPMEYMWVVWPRGYFDPTTSWDVWVNGYTKTSQTGHFKYILPVWVIIVCIWGIIAYIMCPYTF
jgi:H+/gluconate symporter-like permease